MKYKVINLMDDTWQVVDTIMEQSYYQGSLADCEAWINLKEKGYL